LEHSGSLPLLTYVLLLTLFEFKQKFLFNSIFICSILFTQAETDNRSLRETLQQWQSLSENQFSSAPSTEAITVLNDRIASLESEIAAQCATIHSLSENQTSLETNQANMEKETLVSELERFKQRAEDAHKRLAEIQSHEHRLTTQVTELTLALDTAREVTLPHSGVCLINTVSFCDLHCGMRWGLVAHVDVYLIFATRSDPIDQGHSSAIENTELLESEASFLRTRVEELEASEKTAVETSAKLQARLDVSPSSTQQYTSS
jgi:uncharacterized coiled-coil protein SlyX